MRSSSGCICVLIWAYSQVVQAYTKFEPECTNPKEAVNFVASPPTRGTLDILWSSLFTIFACTWTVLHLNVPEQRDGRDPGMLGNLKWKMKAVLGKAKWMLTTVMAPELLLFYALSRLINSREQHRRIKALARIDQVPWTLAHTTFAGMGGFVVRGGSDRIGKNPMLEVPATQIQSGDGAGNDLPKSEIPAIQTQSENGASNELSKSEIPAIQIPSGDGAGNELPKSEIPATQTQSEDRASNELSRSETPKSEIHSRGTEEWYILDLDTILKLREDENITLPSIPTAEIDDHSKGDNFTKAIAAVQIIWTIASSITRAYRGLAISQLEVSVIAFSVCALLIYTCYWSCPKDVSVPITFLQWEGPVPSIIKNVIGYSTWDATVGHRAVPNDYVFINKVFVSQMTIILGPLFFGAPHLLAWNFTFPTPAERIIWRATSLYCSLVGLILAVTGSLASRLPYTFLDDVAPIMSNIFDNYIEVFMGGIYILARLFLLVETFRTLLFLPPSAYIATWTSSVPMFG